VAVVELIGHGAQYDQERIGDIDDEFGVGEWDVVFSCTHAG
jgi:hypothetical protein